MNFNSINFGGIVGGESEVNAVFQTINGISLSSWFSGFGIGVDYYCYKTLPLFIDARKFFGKQNKGFVYADLGYNFPLKNKPGKEVSYYNTYRFKGGIYTDFGLGYKSKFTKRSPLLFSLSYSYKELQNKTGVVICPFVGPCYVDYNKYNFKYARIALKAGVDF